MFSGPTAYAESVDQVMLYIVIVSVILLLGISFAMVYFVFKYNRKKHPKAAQIEGNLTLEIIWIAIPTIIVMSMFYYGYAGYNNLRKTAEESMIVNVRGKMWVWDFIYENGKKTDTLYIPIGETTRLDMMSLDVNHSFYLPAFRLKEDVIGGKTTFMFLTPRETGSYDIACAEYCGLKHSGMYSKLVVMEKDEFEKWYNTPTEGMKDSTIKAEPDMPSEQAALDSNVTEKQ